MGDRALAPAVFVHQCFLASKVKVLRRRLDVLVSPPAAVHHDPLVVLQGRAELVEVRQDVGGLQRGDDSLHPGHELERLEGLLVGDSVVLGPPDVLQEGVLRANAGVIQTSADAVRLDDLAVVVLQELAERSVQDPGLAVRQGGGVPVGVQAISSGLDADEPHVLVLHEVVEESHGVAAAANARHEDVRLAAELLQALRPRLLADHGVEVSHHHRVGVGPGHRTQDVVGGLHVRHPVPDGLGGGVLEGGRSCRDRPDLRAKELHPEHVKGLPLHVLGSHVNDALEAQAGAHGGSGHAVLARPGLRDDPLLPELLAHEGLAEGVVDLVGPGVVQVLPLEVDLAAVVLREPLRVVQRGRPPDVVLQQPVQLVLEVLVVAQPRVVLLQDAQGVHQGLGHVLPAVLAVPPVQVRPLRGL
mmetsp:Transcript_11982/g.33139  ORF Transcript_11982/g.33139 Transcript_11982/m.33139 type:complete len:415 (-) Transcript_11982:284-1528(-)